MRSTPARLRGLFAALALVIGTSAATAAGGPVARVPHTEKPPMPVLNLPDRQSAGQRALDLLGKRLPEVAAHYRMSPDEFSSRMLNDRSMRLDQRGRVLFVEEIFAPMPGSSGPLSGTLAASPAPGAGDSLLRGTLLPLDQTFFLHSKPGAKRTLYLNFKGATLTGTAWNDTAGSTTLTAAPFDLDGIPGTFSTAELERIQYIWQRVAEDFAPMDINVTTEAPPPELISRAGTGDDVYGTVALITRRDGVYSCSCGGVAYLGAFDDTTEKYKPALVFYDALGSGNEKYVAEAVSHEVGHNLGLGHDGNSSTGYYTGHGSGATGWAPIMGVGYYKPLAQWSRGEYLDANNRQDDFAVMQTNGLPLRNDDHGDGPATATPLAGTASGGVTTVAASGIIGSQFDVDVFAFTAAAGTASFSITPAVRSPNLDAWVGLRDASGQLLANINPADTLNASFTVNLPVTGTYYLSVQGTGRGDPLVDGYTAYGSVGLYAVSGSFLTPGNLAPVAVANASTLRGTAPLSVSFSGAGSSDPDGSLVAYDWTFSDGPVATGVSTTRSFTSPGSYVAQLRVTDNGGLSALASVTVTVDAPVVILSMRVADIAMSRTISKTGQATATAAVKVVDAAGQPVPSANVTGSWSGLVTGAATVATDAAGIARFTSKPSKAKTGSFVFTVTQVTRSGYSYAPLTNTETSDSIAR